MIDISVVSLSDRPRHTRSVARMAGRKPSARVLQGRSLRVCHVYKVYLLQTQISTRTTSDTHSTEQGSCSEADSSSASDEIPAFYSARRSVTVYKSKYPAPVTILSQMNPNLCQYDSF